MAHCSSVNRIHSGCQSSWPRYRNQFPDDLYNNLGYMLIKNKRSAEAAIVLSSTLQHAGQNDYFRRALVNYNLSIAYYVLGKLDESLKSIEASLSYSTNLAKVRRECECLLRIDTGNNYTVEDFDKPDLFILGTSHKSLLTAKILELDAQVK